MTGSKSSVISAAGKTCAKNPLLTVFLILVVAADVALALIPPLILERVVNGLADGTASVKLGILYFASLALAGAADSGQSLLITVFGQKMTHALRSLMCAKLRRLPAGYFTENETGKTVSRFVNDVDTVEALFDNGIISMFADACKVIGIIIVVFTRSMGLGIMLLAVTPLLFIFTRRVQRGMLSAQRENREAVARVNNHIPETVRCIRMIHAFGREKYMEARYGEYIRFSYRCRERANLYDSIYSPVVLVTGSAVIAVMMVLAASGGEMQTFFGMSVGTAVAVINYVGKVFSPLESIGMEIENIQSAVAGVGRIDGFLAERERDMPAGSVPAAADGTPAVSLEGVDFSYIPGKPVLKGFDLEVRRGETVTLAGRTGTGKSTVLRLLLGLYSPQNGSVRIFGENADDIPDAGKRKLFGYVEQSFRPVPGTVAEQISLFDPALGQEEIESAARLVGMHDVISALPAGYDTPYAESLFSQGQRQLLSIARAVAADPEILLPDEMTANLDSGTEDAVMQALLRATGGRTVLSVSHRLSGRLADRTVQL